MSKTLRYQISNWDQITECLSNNSKNLFLSLSEYLDDTTLRGKVLQVNHPNYGVLFAAMIRGTGSLITDVDEEGNDIPFLTTEEILKQIAKFGFFVTYDVKSNLPPKVITYLSELYNLGYDKITEVYLGSTTESGSRVWRPTVLVIKSYQDNDDILTFDCKLTQKKFQNKLAANSIVNVTHEEGMEWDWLHYIANISDLLDENIDPRDDFETDTGLVENPYAVYGDIAATPAGYTVYTGEEDDE